MSSPRFIAGLLSDSEYYLFDQQTSKLYAFGSRETVETAAEVCNEDPSLIRSMMWSRRLGKGELFIPLELENSLICTPEELPPEFVSTVVFDNGDASLAVEKLRNIPGAAVHLEEDSSTMDLTVYLNSDEVVQAAAALLVAAGLDPSTTVLPTKADIMSSDTTTLA